MHAHARGFTIGQQNCVGLRAVSGPGPRAVGRWAVAGRGPAFSETREGHALSGWETAFALGVLKLGPQIISLQLSTYKEKRKPNILGKFPGCCEDSY